MRTLNDPRTIGQTSVGGNKGERRGASSKAGLKAGSLFPTAQSRSGAPASGAAGTISDTPPNVGRTPRVRAGIGLSSKKFLTQLVGKLGQRTLLAG